MKIAWTNRADSASITVDSEKAGLPGSNVQQAHVSRQWHTAAGVKSAYAIFDLGSSLACDLAALLGTNLTSSGTVQIRASDADSTVTSSLLRDTGVVACGAKSGYGQVYKSFTTATARYWRIDIADSTVPDNLQVGRVFLGPSWTPTYGQLYGWSVTAAEESKVSKSYGGQAYPDERPQARVLAFELDFMTEAEAYGNVLVMARAQGLVRDVLAIPDISGSYLPEQAVWGLCRASEPLVHRLSQIYRQKFTIEERL